MSRRILEEELRKRSVFRDPGALFPDYIPPVLLHRNEELRWLANVFRPIISSGASQRALIVGNIGVGKTVLAYKFGTEFQEIARGRNVQLDYLHLNCRKDRTVFAVYAKLVHHYNPRWPHHGLGPEKLFDMVITYLEAHDRYLLLALDEVDYFVKLNGPDLLFTLTRAAEEKGMKNRISLIGIAHDKRFLDRLDPPTRSTLMHNMLVLRGYTSDELVDILKQRVELAFHPGTVDPEAVQLIADIAARWGNARLALELLWRAGLVADGQGANTVLPEHAREAKSEVYPEIRRDVLRDLQPHEKLTLLATVRRLRSTGQAYVLTGEVRDTYRVVCEEYGEKPRGTTQFWTYLQKLQTLGLVHLKPSGPGHRGQSTRISIPDVPLSWLEKELLQVIKRKGS
jgi:cell division control protein 6